MLRHFSQIKECVKARKMPGVEPLQKACLFPSPKFPKSAPSPDIPNGDRENLGNVGHPAHRYLLEQKHEDQCDQPSGWPQSVHGVRVIHEPLCQGQA